jgi:beta-lactam-binding protein with PASTA domain
LKEFILFFKSKVFLKHLVLALLALFVLIWAVFKALDIYTLHGETIPVPDFTGLKISELPAFVKDKKLNYRIIDSIYDPKAPKGIVIRQDPAKKIAVKQNRTIYLYVTTQMPPQVLMPKLRDKSLRQAISMLESYGLKVGHTQFKPDQCANCILEQRVKGKKIEAGTSLPKGTVIDLIVGKGLSNEKVAVPNLSGLNYAQVLDKLSEFSLSEGVATFETPADTLHEKLYRQLPGPGKDRMIRMGSSIDLFFTNDKDKLKQTTEPEDSTSTP